MRDSNEGLSDSRRRSISKYLRSEYSSTHLEIGKEYVIFGVLMRDNHPWFYVLEDDADKYPKPFPADYFEQADIELPIGSFLVCSQSKSGFSETQIVPKTWANSPHFYERLIDGDLDAEEKFEEIREEFSDLR